MSASFQNRLEVVRLWIRTSFISNWVEVSVAIVLRFF